MSDNAATTAIEEQSVIAAVQVLIDAGYGVALLPQPRRSPQRIETFGVLLPGGCSMEMKLRFARKLIASVTEPYGDEVTDG